jgi:serine/threonine protein phosphatase PrpC
LKPLEPLQHADPRYVGRYRLLGRLGAGGMGHVFLAESPGGRKLAVKLIRPEYAADGQFRERFAREVAAARQVGGFHTALVIDADTAADQPWMASAYIPGPSLQETVASALLDHAAARTLGAALAEGLEAIHDCGLVHRDLKPSNIIMADDGPRIIDFGIAKVAGASPLTVPGMVMGTFAFMSPEQVGSKRVGPESDIFSLGSVLFFAVTGDSPFAAPDPDEASFPALFHRIRTIDPDLSRVHGTLRQVVAACLSKDPGRRPAAGEVLARLSVPLVHDSPSRKPAVPAAHAPTAPALPEAGMCTACSAGSKDPVFAGEDGYCPSCGRRVGAEGDPIVTNRDHVEWNLGQVAGVSDRGLQRHRNEDAMDFAVVDTHAGPIVVAIVSDGVSSAPRPHDASWMAVQAGIESLAYGMNGKGDPVEISRAAVKAAGQALTELVGPEGTPAVTYVSAIVTSHQMTVCWLGDCRAYWLTAESSKDRFRRSWQVTRDDSLAEEIVPAGRAIMGKVEALPRARRIIRWLGADLPNAEPHIEQFTPSGPGVLLLCSPGLWSYHPKPADLAAMALPAALKRPLDAAADLVKSAIDSGGLDNITAVLIPFPPQP